MSLTTEQVTQIAKYLNYEYWQRAYLTSCLTEKSSHYGNDWDEEVGEILIRLIEIESEESSSVGDVIEVDIVGEIRTKFQDDRTKNSQLRAKKSKILAELFRVIEIYPNSNSSNIIR